MRGGRAKWKLTTPVGLTPPSLSCLLYPGWESEQQTADVIAGLWFTRAKRDGQKVTIAVRLRAETAMTVKWIAQRLRPVQ